MSAPGRLSLADVPDGCYFTDDDIVAAIGALVDDQCEVAYRVFKLLNEDAGRSVADMTDILDVTVIDIAYALAHLTQAGAIFQTIPLATGETGYKLVDWV